MGNFRIFSNSEMLRTKSADPTRAVRTAATNNRVHLRSSSGMRQPHRPEMSSELRILDEERLRVEPERVQLNDIITNRIYEGKEISLCS